MSTATETENVPFHLRGNFAPVSEEITAFDLQVQGEIPRQIFGQYVRNGPNPASGSSAHWFQGDGMLHGVHLENGAARWYRNRWVQTRYLTEGEDAVVFVSDKGEVDLTASKSNTHVVCHAGRVLALVESSFPMEMTRELETVGLHDFGGALTTAMTAHPKLCPTTGEMHFFGYGFSAPFLTYHVADASGALVHSEEIPVRGPTMTHDFAITEHHALFMDLPVVFSPERLVSGGMPYGWSDEYGARIGVMPRRGSAADLVWFDVDPCYIFHPLNAWADGERVVMDAARYPELWRDSDADFRSANLHRYTFDLASGSVSEERLDDQSVEFPRIDPRREGRRNRFGYAVRYQDGPDGPALNGLLRYDLEGGAVSQAHEFGAGRTPGEGVFVPAGADAAEDEGFVLAYVYDEGRNASDLVILDAQRFDGPPLATVQLPQRVPFGFHGSWIPA
jgi:carotenoid cleavage dioxygenase-like enzyme